MYNDKDRIDTTAADPSTAITKVPHNIAQNGKYKHHRQEDCKKVAIEVLLSSLPPVPSFLQTKFPE